MKHVTDNSDNRGTVYSPTKSAGGVSKTSNTAYGIRAYRKCILFVCENSVDQKIISTSRIKESLCNFVLVNNRITVNFINN